MAGVSALAYMVPSATIGEKFEDQWNVLINPNHPAWEPTRLKVVEQDRWLDERLDPSR